LIFLVIISFQAFVTGFGILAGLAVIEARDTLEWGIEEEF